jgi:dolichol-phosphate mannosyltransferase
MEFPPANLFDSRIAAEFAVPMSSPFVIVPTYRELENLPRFTERLWTALPDARLLLIDDASDDGAPDWIKRHPRYGQSLFLIERAGKLGLGSAYVEGFTWVTQQIRQGAPCAAVVQMDADLSHDPAAIHDFLRELAAGADLVLATRYRGGVRVTNWSLRRLLLSLSAARYVQLITRMPFTDPTGGFKAFRPERLAEIDWHEMRSDGYAFQIEVTYMAWRRGWKIVEVPITFEDRMAGASKLSLRIVREAVWRVPWMALRGSRRSTRTAAAPGEIAA